MRPILVEIEERLMEEIDYEQEARHLTLFKNRFHVDQVTVPDFFPETSCHNILSQSRITGMPLNEWLNTGPSQTARDTVANRLHAIYMHGLYELNCIHADPNPGNFLIGPDLEIGLVDYGCVKCFDRKFVDLYKQMPRMAITGTSEEVWGLIKAFGMLGEEADPQTSEKITAIFMETGKWFAELYKQEYFDFGAHPDFIEKGKQLSFQSMDLRKYMKDVNTNFVFLHRTRYGLIRLFEQMQARVRMWNEYEYRG